jgi:hypothetical protein
VNAGVNVDPTTKLFTIVDLSNVWIVADVYERDLHWIREGVRAMASTTAYPDRQVEGRVGFIDPQLNATTRTARVRIEAANPRSELRLGMYADVSIDSVNGAPVLAVPKDAVQNVGDRQVVYVPVPGDLATFVEREVRLGRLMADQIEVLSGLTVGDSVVSRGSFFVRAEAERLGVATARTPPSSVAKTGGADLQVEKIAVTENGFDPAKVRLRAGIPARLTFVRTTDKTCATEVVFPSMKIRRALPLKQPVEIEFTPGKTGEIAFACGMNMLSGLIIVE